MQGGTIFSQISRSILETVIVRWAHAARQLKASNSLSIHTTFSVIAPGASPAETKMWQNSDFWSLTHRLKHRITPKLLKIDR